MVFLITIAGCPVSGSSLISGDSSFYHSQNFFNTLPSDNIPGPDRDYPGWYIADFLYRFIKGSNNFDINRLSLSEKIQYNAFFTQYTNSETMVSKSEITHIFSLILKCMAYTNNSGSPQSFVDEYCDAASGSCPVSTSSFGSLIITWPPPCGDNCYPGNGDTGGSGTSDNGYHPPCVGNECPP